MAFGTYTAKPLVRGVMHNIFCPGLRCHTNKSQKMFFPNFYTQGLIPPSLIFRKFHKVAVQPWRVLIVLWLWFDPQAHYVNANYQIEELCDEHITLPCYIDTLVPTP